MVGNNDVTIVGEEEVHVAHALMGVPGSDLSRNQNRIFTHTGFASVHELSEPEAVEAVQCCKYGSSGGQGH